MNFEEHIIEDKISENYSIRIEKPIKKAIITVSFREDLPIEAKILAFIRTPMKFRFKDKKKEVELVSELPINLNEISDLEELKKMIIKLEESAKEKLKCIIENSSRILSNITEIEKFLKERGFEIEFDIKF